MRAILATFSVFVMATLVISLQAASAQNNAEDPFMMENDIQGSYTNQNGGYSIEFPPGWEGIEFADSFPIVSPTGVNFFEGAPR